MEEIFSADLGALEISIKTRLGLESPEEFPRLAEIFSRFPISLLILHPRVRADFYKVPVRGEEFVKALPYLKCPVCYNGGIVTAAGCARLAAELPQIHSVMIGQGLAVNPALARQAKGGPRWAGRSCGPSTTSSTAPISRTSPGSEAPFFT